MSQEVQKISRAAIAPSRHSGDRFSEQVARLSLRLPELALLVDTQADLDSLEAAIDQHPGRDQIRRSGAYHRAMSIVQKRLRTAEMFTFDRGGGVSPLAYGSGRALYFDREFGFFFCEPNLYTVSDGDVDLDLVVSTFFLFAPDAMTEKEAKKRIKAFLPIAGTIAGDVQRGHWPEDLVGHVAWPCEYAVKIMKFGYDDPGSDQHGRSTLECKDEFYSWFEAFRGKNNRWVFTPGEKDAMEDWSIQEFIENIPEGPVRRQYADFLKDMRCLQKSFLLMNDAKRETGTSKTRH